MNKTVEKIPTWAFGYIFNGDMTGLTDEEVQPYFTRYPLFGLPTDVVDCVILYK